MAAIYENNPNLRTDDTAELRGPVLAKPTDRKLEAVAKAIFWEMNSVMHDHEQCWRECDKQNVYRDCARAAIVAAAHFK